MNIPLVDLKAQYSVIQGEIDAAIQNVISRGAFIGGPQVKRFEKAFAAYCGVRDCVGVGSGTDALFIALKALGIGPGDEVITVANSFIATSEAITMAGAKVVFVDIDPDTYNINVNSIEEKISSRTRAIIPVHLFGQPADMKPILDLAMKYKLKVVEDAAQAHGARYRGQSIGSLGHAACFSFYPGKNLGAYGDGGAIVTNDDELALQARMIANHGRVEKYDHEIEGVNSRLDELQAAILAVKLKYLEVWTESRRKIAYLYDELLRNCSIKTPVEIGDIRAVYHLYVIRVKNGVRSVLQQELKARGISTGIHYPLALPNLKAYGYLKHSLTDFPEALKASHEILSLPIYPELKVPQVQYIVDTLREIYRNLKMEECA